MVNRPRVVNDVTLLTAVEAVPTLPIPTLRFDGIPVYALGFRSINDCFLVSFASQILASFIYRASGILSLRVTHGPVT